MCFESGKMMAISSSDTQQDTIRFSKIVINESIRLRTFSLPEERKLTSKDPVRNTLPPAPKIINEFLIDTTTVYKRNIIADITFNDRTNFIATIDPGFNNRFPFTFIEKNRLRQAEAKATLVRHLKSGQDIHVQTLHVSEKIHGTHGSNDKKHPGTQTRAKTL